MSWILLVFATCSHAPATSGPDVVLGPVFERNVSFEEEVSCKGEDGWLEKIEVRVAVPQDDERQKIRGLRFDPAPDAFRDDGNGTRVAVYQIARLDPGQSLRLGWTCHAEIREIEHKVDPATLRPLSDVPDEIRPYLAAGDRYDMDDPRVQEVARKIGAAARGPLDLAFRINEYLRQHLTYKNDGRWDRAGRVLEQGHGSCSEYNFALIALARLNGLPARYVGSTALRSDADTYVDTVHHRWTEVYLPGHGWFPVDASRNDGEDGAPINRWFGRTADHLLVLMKGDGGPKAPLHWSYVSASESTRHGHARLTGKKSFTWTRPETLGGN